MGVVRFFYEDIVYKVTTPSKVKSWIKSLVENEKKKLIAVNYIVCSDEYLLKINQEYLDHDYYTDIITFDNSENEGEIEGDIFISLDRVRENALSENADETTEFRRVLAHGVLHLCGFDDGTNEDKHTMRSKEDLYLSMFK